MRFDAIFLDKMVFVSGFYEALLQEYGAEYLHKYRVNLRKIYAYSEIFCYEIDPISAKEFSKFLKKIIKPTSLLRDLDLFCIEIDSFAITAKSKKHLHVSCEEQRKPLLKEMQSETYKKNLYELEHIFKNNPLFENEFDEQNSYKLLVATSQTLLGAFTSITQETTPKDLHKLRIQFKKFRYALELYDEHFSHDKLSIMFDLKALQDIFGTLQDNEVRKVLLNSCGGKMDIEEKNLLRDGFEKNIADAREILMELARECDV